MNDVQIALIGALQHGPLSGPELGRLLGISRAAVWKQIHQLRIAGLPLRNRARRGAAAGYLLPAGCELLNTAAIHRALPPALGKRLALEVLAATDSTNNALLRRPAAQRAGVCCLAETQSAGRGRRGRTWYSPPLGGIYLSLAWRFADGLGALGLLGVLCALNCATALGQLSGLIINVKWPNDLYRDGRKLGGLLIELQGGPNGPCDAVLGVGVNWRLYQPAKIDRPAADLAAAPAEPGRNDIAAALIAALATACESIPHVQPAAVQRAWDAADLYHHQPVVVSGQSGTVAGIDAGIDERGGLRLVKDGKIMTLYGGELSVSEAGDATL